MSTWAQMFPGSGDPLSGKSSDYNYAAFVAGTLKDATTLVADEFSRVREAGELEQLEGQAARQLVTYVTEVHSRLDHVPPFFTSLDDVFEHHATELAKLEQRAADALALATTRWRDIDTAESEQQSAQSAVTSIENQIRQLDWSTEPPEVIEERRTEFEGIRSSRRTTLTQRTNALTTARSLLDDVRSERDQIELDEQTLVELTASKLRGLDVGKLEDPNALVDWVTDRFDDLAGFVGGIVDSVVGLVDAIMEGDWGAALWHLSDLLDAALKILAVVALVAAVVLTGGTGLLVAGLIIGGVKLAVDASLAATQTPHPVTGKTKSWGEVAMDAAFLAVDAALFGAASKGKSFFWQGDQIFDVAGPHRRSMVENARQIWNPVSSSGNPLYGAARTSTISRSAREYAASGWDLVYGDIKGDVRNEIKDGVVNAVHGPDITTNPDHWVADDVVGFVESSPIAPQLRQNIAMQTASVDQFHQQGPSLHPGTPGYCLAAA